MTWLDERSVGIRPRAGQTGALSFILLLRSVLTWSPAEDTSFDSTVEDTTDALSRSDSQLNIEEVRSTQCFFLCGLSHSDHAPQLNTDERGSASETKSDKR